MARPVEVKDLGIGKLKEQMATLKNHKVMLGVQGGAAREPHPSSPDITVGQLAYWLHFGTITMRKRPYIDQAIATLTSAGAVRATARRIISDVVDGRAPEGPTALRPLGELGVKAVQAAIDDANSWVDWELSAATKNRKGHDRHLIETSTVRNAQSYTIRLGGNVVVEQ